MTDRTDTLPRIEPIIARLHARFPRMIDLDLDRLRGLLAKLGHPERRLPPVLHVGGTNGKGSTVAMLRAMAEAAGLSVHAYTSPHLVRFNERYRLAGEIASDEVLSAAFLEIEGVNGGAAISVFEVFTAAAFLLSSRVKADLCLLEVGLGGRGDATNVVERPAACGITSISLDHREMLGDTIAAIAAEKAGIMKPGVPVATGAQPGEALSVLRDVAARVQAPLLVRGADWTIEPEGEGLRFADAAGSVVVPRPGLLGEHQVDNAGVALAMVRAAGVVPSTGYAGLAAAVWPARMQRLRGRLAAMLPADAELWLDGAHNPGGGEALAHLLLEWQDRPLHLVVGMKQAKDVGEFLRPLLPLAGAVWAVQEPGQHQALPIEHVVAASGGVARPGPRVVDALRRVPSGVGARAVICGSLYLAGEVLKLDAGEIA